MEHLPYETLAINDGDYCYWVARPDNTQHDRAIVRFAFPFELVNVVFGVGWYAIPDHDKPVVVAHGDSCRVTLAREHAPAGRITLAYGDIVHPNYPETFGVYVVGVAQWERVDCGDYCRADSDAAWLYRMVATYGPGAI
jgi:hypothetical protein